MAFHEQLKLTIQDYGINIFNGKKSVGIFLDLHLFDTCPGLKEIYIYYITNGGNELVLDIANRVISKRNFEKQSEMLLRHNKFREDMIKYLIESFEYAFGCKDLTIEPYFDNVYDAYFQCKQNNRNVCYVAALSLICMTIFVFYLAHTESILDRTPEHIINKSNSEINRDIGASDFVIHDTARHKDVVNKNIQSAEPMQHKTKETNPISRVAKQTSVTLEERAKNGDKSSFIPLAKKYLENPSTHYLSERYAKMAIESGIKEGNDIIKYLKVLGYYD